MHQQPPAFRGWKHHPWLCGGSGAVLVSLLTAPATFDVPAGATEESERGLGALSPGAMQALVRARQWRHCYYTWPQSPFKALEDELCFIYIKEAISEPICDQICCQRNFALSHYI